MSDSLPHGDVSDEIVAFAIDNYKAIINRIPEVCVEFFRNRRVIDLLPKYEKGRLEHGTLTDTALLAQDWTAHAQEEMTDLFWYTAMDLFVVSRDGEE